jgi:hypothetical protein
MEHYLDLYMHSYGSILPKETLGYGMTEGLLTEEQKKVRRGREGGREGERELGGIPV